MNEQKTKVIEYLNKLNIDYDIVNHNPVFTIDEMDQLNMESRGDIVKNLFLRDAKGKRHFLVVLEKSKKADLKAIRQRLASTTLSFASEERLFKYLKLEKGSVTPLGIINDATACVEVVFDRDITGDIILGVHPNDNTATVWISYKDLCHIIMDHGNKLTVMDI